MKKFIAISLAIVTLTLIALNFTTYTTAATHNLTPANIIQTENKAVTINGEAVTVVDPNSTLFFWKNTNLTEFTVVEKVNIFGMKRYTITSDDITESSFSEIINQYSTK